MSKILLNGKEVCINDLVNALTYEGGEIDYDTLGAAMDSDTLDKAIDSFTGSYSIYELIDRYTQISDKPIICEVTPCQT